MTTMTTTCDCWRASGTNTCRWCGEDLGPRDDRLPDFDSNPAPRFLGAYRAWLEYGGPEEGGWWRTMMQHVASVMVRRGDDLPAVARALWDSYAEEDDGRRVSDVNSEGAIMVYCEDKPGEHEHLDRGRYC